MCDEYTYFSMLIQDFLNVFSCCIRRQPSKKHLLRPCVCHGIAVISWKSTLYLNLKEGA